MPPKEYRYGKPRNQSRKAKRICLRCRKEFNSEGPQNRICYGCRQKTVFDSGCLEEASTNGMGPGNTWRTGRSHQD